MNNFDDIKKVWLSRDVSSLPKTSDILRLVKKYRVVQALKTSVLLLLTLLLTGMLIWVLFSYHSHMITTRIGEACMLGALLILLLVNVQSLKRITASKTYSNHEFLLYLKQEQVMLDRYQRHTQVVGFLIACVGLSLYVFEAIHQQPITALITYAGVLAWCMFSWFIIRPIALRRKTKQLQQMVQQLEKYTNQLQQE